MSDRIYRFHAQIQPVPEKGGAYIAVPFDIRKEFGKGRVAVRVFFDGLPYDGSVCYVIGLLKSIRERLGKGPGDEVEVVVCPR